MNIVREILVYILLTVLSFVAGVVGMMIMLKALPTAEVVKVLTCGST